jgi:hypothetical protein
LSAAWILLLVGLIGLLALALPTAIVFGVGMAPTLASFVVDPERPRYRTYSVSLLNLAGTVPFIIDLWAGTHSLHNALAIVYNVFSWLVMYGSAAAGWALTVAMPSVVTIGYNAWADKRITLNRQEQARLVQEWGPGVAEGDSAGQPAVRAR